MPEDPSPRGAAAPWCVRDIVEITPNDGADLARIPLAIAVNASGVVQMTLQSGTTTGVYIAAGAPMPFRATRVWSTGTTATGIRGLY